MPPNEDEIGEALDGMDLLTVGINMDSGRSLPGVDIVEELVLIPKIPHTELSALEQAWRKGEKESVTVFEKLTEWHQQGLVPSGWLQAGVRNEEDEEARREEDDRGGGGATALN